jgi:hypothetical protein
MKSIKCKILLLIILLSISGMLLSQNKDYNKYDEMVNAFLLGMNETGLEICHDLISKEENISVRPNALFYIAEHFLLTGFFNGGADLKDIKKAYTFYNIYKDDYPDGEYKDIVNHRIQYLESNFNSNVLFYNLMNICENERVIVNNILRNTNLILEFKGKSPFEFFLEGDFNQSPQFIVNKYYDEIIINHPTFEIYAYYSKIITYIDSLSEEPFYEEGILPYEHKTIVTIWKASMANDPSAMQNPYIYSRIKNQIYKLLDFLDENYTTHTLTLDLHLIISKIFMEKKKNKFNFETLKNLQYILTNDPDHLSIRYLLAKEFVSNNKFASEWGTE